MGCVVSADVLTHYYRPFSRPLLNISSLSRSERRALLERIGAVEPLPLRLTREDYFSRRVDVERRMRRRFVEKGGRPARDTPHYFVLGRFALWEQDGSRKVSVPFEDVSADVVSFTLTDSFFNYVRTNLRGVPVPPRSYHGELFGKDELSGQLELHGLPTEDWLTEGARRFEPYVEAQVWSDEPVKHLLGGGRM